MLIVCPQFTWEVSFVRINNTQEHQFFLSLSCNLQHLLPCWLRLSPLSNHTHLVLPEFMGVRYTPTIVQLGRAQMKFGLGHYQAPECDGSLWHRLAKNADANRYSFANPKLWSNFYVICEMNKTCTCRLMRLDPHLQPPLYQSEKQGQTIETIIIYNIM